MRRRVGLNSVPTRVCVGFCGGSLFSLFFFSYFRGFRWRLVVLFFLISLSRVFRVPYFPVFFSSVRFLFSSYSYLCFLPFFLRGKPRSCVRVSPIKPARLFQIYLLSHLFPLSMNRVAEAPLHHYTFPGIMPFKVCAIPCGSHAGWPGTNGQMQEGG